MKTIEYRNSFHNTSVRVRVACVSYRNGDPEEQLSKSQQRRIERELCGNPDCCCGGHSNYSKPLTDDGWTFAGRVIE